jgi:Domain of unknown function (DUF4166)
MALQGRIPKLVSPSSSDAGLDTTLCDIRFRALLSDEDWGRLPLATWRRFSKRLADGNTAIYVGEVVEVRFSRIGWWLAQLARLIGGPLPTGMDTSVPSIVTVTEDAATGGQVWTRIYTRRKGFPQVIHSSKRFAGPTGLEEYVGYGVGMALRMLVDGQALVFRSAGYFLQVGRRKLPLPALLHPGVLTVTHTDLGRGEFQFTLEIIHPRFGLLVRQSAVFQEATP